VLEDLKSKQPTSEELSNFMVTKSEAIKHLSDSVQGLPSAQNLMVGTGVTDRLVFSISMIKEGLQSNL